MAAWSGRFPRNHNKETDMMQRRHWMQAAAALALAPRLATAQGSAQPIRLLVGFAPGGSVDLTAGGGSHPPGQARRRDPDDGAHGPMTLFPWIHRQLRYDPVKDFTPVGRVCVLDYAISTGPATQARTVAEYVAWARNPAIRAAFASPGAGTIPHFLGQGFAQRAGVEITHVPYKGAAPSMVDLIGGNVSLVVSPLADAMEHHRAGKVRILGTMGSQRNPGLPDVPTLRESGIDLVMEGWYGLYAPAGTPPAQVRSLYQAVEAGVARIEPMLTRAAVQARPAGPEQLAQIQATETALWGPWVKASGFTPED